jgi:hypothetical protein
MNTAIRESANIFYLRALNDILSLHQDICDVLDSNDGRKKKLDAIEKLNNKIGTILGETMPG